MANKTKEENPVYVRLDYSEAIKAKREILSLQMSLLKIIKIIRNYRALRLEELRAKARAYRRIKDLGLSIKKIKTEFPKIRVPQLKRKEEKDFIKERIQAAKKPSEMEMDNGLETQLKDIQEKLKAIGG